MAALALEAVRARALELGFDACGAAPAAALDEERGRLEAWLAEGRHGTMEWLARDPARRCDPRLVLEGCRSVVVVSLNYQRPDEEDRRDAPPVGKVSRYARGRDYHRVMEKKLRKLARWIDAEGAPGERSRPYVDHGPVLERDWALRAGLGFIGKHTLLIDPAAGSWFLLGVVLTTAAMDAPPPDPARDGCGACRACIDACPTGAITEPWRLDARRCLSYLTIEHRGAIDPELQARFDGWVFGCDACQDVCPYNRKRASPREDDPLAPRKAPAEWSLVDLLTMAPGSIERDFEGSPLRRAGTAQLARNAAIVARARADDEGVEEALRIAAERWPEMKEVVQRSAKNAGLGSTTAQRHKGTEVSREASDGGIVASPCGDC